MLIKKTAAEFSDGCSENRKKKKQLWKKKLLWRRPFN
jgi:hypothetical protein